MSNPLDALIPKPPEPVPTFHWATVTDNTPLAIRFDRDDEPLAGPPSTLITVAIDDRVFVVIVERRATILGKAQ